MRVQQESNKIREVLIIQDILRMLADDSVRQDFLDGTNGAVRIEQADMDLLEKLYVEVTPKRPTRSDEPTFVQSATHSANTFSSVIDSRPKTFGESTYDHVKEVLQSIQNSGYFEKEIIQVEPKPVEGDCTTEGVSEEEKSDDEKRSVSEINPDLIEAPAANAVPQPEGLMLPNNQAALQNIQQIQTIPNMVPGVPIVNQVLPGAHPPLPATTVRAVEHAYYKQYIHQQQVPQQQQQPPIRPEQLIGAGNFFFLQDSELESDLSSGFAVPPGQPSPQQKPGNAIVSQGPPGQPTIQSVPTTIVPNVNSIPPHGQSNPMTLPSAFTNQNFPSMVQPMFNNNSTVNTGGVSDLNAPQQQSHIPGFTNVSQQNPLPLTSASSQPAPGILQPIPVLPDPLRAMPGFVTQNQHVQHIAQLQSMIQQQQQLGSTNALPPTTVPFVQQSSLDADNLTEKLKTTLHINDNKNTSTSSNDSGSNVKSLTPQTNNRTGSSGSRDFDVSSDHHANEMSSKDWNDLNDSNSWSNQMAEESARNERYKRNSGTNGNNMYGRSDKYSSSGGTGTYRPRNSNTYQSQNGNRMGNSGESGVFFRNNDRYYQNSNKPDTFIKSSGNNSNMAYNKPRNDMMRPPRMSGGTSGPSEYRPRPNNRNGPGSGMMPNGPTTTTGRDNRSGLKA